MVPRRVSPARVAADLWAVAKVGTNREDRSERRRSRWFESFCVHWAEIVWGA